MRGRIVERPRTEGRATDAHRSIVTWCPRRQAEAPWSGSCGDLLSDRADREWVAVAVGAAKARNNARKSTHLRENSERATTVTKAAQRNSKRPSTAGRNKALTEIALVEAVADSDVVYAIGAALPPKPQGSPGQDRYYPEVLVAFNAAFAGGAGTWRKGAAIMEEPAYWKIIRRYAAQHGVELWERPPLRCNCEDARDRVCPKPPKSDSSSDTKKRRA